MDDLSIMMLIEKDEIYQYDFGARVEAKDVERVVNDAMKHVLKEDLQWKPDKFEPFLRLLADTIHEKIKVLKKSFKFVVNIDIGPNVGAGMDMTLVGFWEQDYDGYVKVNWTNGIIFVWVVVMWIRN